MAKTTKDARLAAELESMLTPQFDGMKVEVAHSERWNRMCVTFRWKGFADLLPEERFHRLAHVIPEEFRSSRLVGFVWLELAPKETIDSFLALPRSEDVAARERAIFGDLEEAVFFKTLAESMQPAPDRVCPGDFTLTAAALSYCGFSAERIRDAKLVFIRHGAYCDCQVLQTAQPVLAELYADAA